MDSNNLAVPPPYNRLKFFNFSSILNWSASAILVNRLDYRDDFKFVKIGKLIHRVKDTIKIQEDKEYQRVTIRVQGRGVTERDREIGKNIGTKNQFSVSAGQFIMSKIDARNGAFGIVPKELDGAAVTQDFLTYSFNKNLIVPEFFVLLTTTKQFYDLCQRASSGTTNRQRIDEQIFLNFEIPVPSLEEQMKLVEAYNEKLNKASMQEKQNEIFGEEIKEVLIKELGIRFIKNEKQIGKLNLIKFSVVNRWDTLALLDFNKVVSSFPLVKQSYIIKDFLEKDNQSLRIETYKEPKCDFEYIGMENVEKNSGQVLDFQKVKGKDIKSQTILVPNGYFLFGKLRPYLNKYWFNTTLKNNLVCSSEFFVFSINEAKIDKQYYLMILSSEIIQQQIINVTSGARMPRINEQTFFDLHFPLPPIEIQRKIIEFINIRQIEIIKNKTSIYDNRKQALETFENALFNKKP